MIRRLYRGDFQPTLERAFAREVALLQADDPFRRVVVVVPSNLLKLHLRRMLAAERAHLNVRFWTLLDLAREIAGAGVGRIAPLISSIGAHLLARDVAAEADGGSYFEGVRRLAGFPSVLAATIRDVRDARVTAADVERAAGSRKVEDFARLLAAYERRLHESGFIDDADLFALAVDAAVGSDAAAEPILLYGFYDFTSAQRRLVEVVLERAGGVVFAPIGESEAFAFARPTLEFFRGAGFVEECVPAPPVEVDRASSLARLRERLYRDAAGTPAPDDGTARIIAAPGAPLEAREVVRAIQELVADGVKLHEIAVLARVADGLTMVDDAFRELVRAAGLEDAPPPLFRHGGVPLAEARAARAVLLLLRLIRSDLRRRDLFEWMHHSGVEPRAVALERVARRVGILGHGIAEWRRGLGVVRRRLAFEREQAEREELRGDADTGAAAFDDDAYQRRLDEVVRLEEWVERIAVLGVALAGTDRIAPRIAALVQFLRSLDGATDGLDATCDVLERLVDLDRLGARVDFDMFAGLVEEALLGDRIRDGRFGGGLFLGTVLAARGLAFRAVIVPGLVDGVFPRQARPDPILLDHERRDLSAALLPSGDPGLPLAGRARAEERMLFYLVCAQAGDRLTLSWPRVDAETAKERAPSSALVAAASALAGRSVSATELAALPYVRVPRVEPDVDAPRAALDPHELDRIHVARAIRDCDPERVRFLETIHPPFAHAVRAELARWRNPEYTEWDGLVGPDVAAAIRGGPTERAMSPSRLEAYAHCPFSFFAQTALGVGEYEDPEELAELSPLERGALVHSILEEFIGALIADREPFPLDGTRRRRLWSRLDAVATRHFARFKDECSVKNELLWRAECGKIRADLHVYLDREIGASGARAPELLEVRFGRGSDHPPLEVVVGDRRLLVSGAIDRVDRAGSAATVIDYKTGKSKPKWDGGLKGGRALQLPLYALAFERVIAPGASVDRAEYFYCTTKASDTQAHQEASAGLWREGEAGELHRVLRAIAEGIARGVFLADPRDDGRCRFCAYRLACGRGAGLEARFERKRREGEVAAYFDLRAEDDA